MNKALKYYTAQKSNAKIRGIEFKLTFKEWCDFWGDDFDLRGRGPYSLQMQRYADSGPYEIGNIKKGIPKENSKTYQNMRNKRLSDNAYIELQKRLDRAIYEDSSPELDDIGDPDLYKLGIRSSANYRYFFKDKT